VPTQISRLLKGHEQILTYSREGAGQASDAGDEGTNDLLVSEVVRTNELQVWFLAEHLAGTPLLAQAR
jgi:starvation-inducible DNA-binding protein